MSIFLVRRLDAAPDPTIDQPAPRRSQGGSTMATSAFPSSYVTGGAVAAPAREASATACPACPHGMDAHDGISARFCRATAAATGTASRGCICRS